MEKSLGVKVNALELLERQLYNKSKKGQQGIIALSSASDPYLQFEKDYQLTRGALELILKYKFPVHIITKSDLVERDFDLLNEIDKQAIIPAELRSKLKRGTILTFSFSSVDDRINKIFEPGATIPSKRLNTLEKAVDHGLLSGVSMMPLLPYITDTTASLNEMYSAFKTVGANYVMPASITLFGHESSDSRTLVFRAVEKHFPELLPKYQKLLGTNVYMPSYYVKAFVKKMKELAVEYNVPDRIIYL